MSSVVFCQILQYKTKYSNPPNNLPKRDKSPHIEIRLTFRQSQVRSVARVHHWDVLHNVGARPNGRPLPQRIVPRGSPKMKRGVDLQLRWLVGLKPDRSDKRSVSRAQIHQIGNVKVLMVDKGGMHSGAAGVVNTEIIHLRIPPKEIALLLVNHQFLYQLEESHI